MDSDNNCMQIIFIAIRVCDLHFNIGQQIRFYSSVMGRAYFYHLPIDRSADCK